MDSSESQKSKCTVDEALQTIFYWTMPYPILELKFPAEVRVGGNVRTVHDAMLLRVNPQVKRNV